MDRAAGCDSALVTHEPEAPPGSTGETKECQEVHSWHTIDSMRLGWDLALPKHQTHPVCCAMLSQVGRWRQGDQEFQMILGSKGQPWLSNISLNK